MIEKDEEYFFGTELKEYRIKNNMTQQQVAQMIGSDPKYVSQIELGKNKCTLKMLIKFCKAYNVTPNDILYKYINKLNTKSELEDFTTQFFKLSKADRKIVNTLINALLEKGKQIFYRPTSPYFICFLNLLLLMYNILFFLLK